MHLKRRFFKKRPQNPLAPTSRKPSKSTTVIDNTTVVNGPAQEDINVMDVIITAVELESVFDSTPPSLDYSDSFSGGGGDSGGGGASDDF